MKKLLLVLMLVSSTSVWAHGPYHHYHGRPYWVAPVIIGAGAIGYAIARSQAPVVVQTPTPVIISEPAVVPPGYHYVMIFDPACNCYKQVLMVNQ